MSEIVLMATRGGHSEAEAEPVIVERHDRVVRLLLDDGETLEFDAVELEHAMEAAA